MTKLVQPNVLRAYQSGEQYAINELVLYNSVPAYTNTALAQGVAGTATDFNPVSKANIPAYASDTVYAVGDLVRDATEFKNVYECGIAHTGTLGMTAANWIPVGTRRIRITGSGAGSYAAGTWYSPVSAYGTMYQTHVTLDGGITSFNLNYGVGINEEVTVVNATGSDITFTMPSSCFWLGINGGVATAVLASGESFIFTKEGYNLLTHIVRVRRTKPYFNANGFRLSNANSETLYTSFVSNLTAARTLTLADADVNLGSISTSSIAGATFVYTAGMGSVVKTITDSGATFNVDALASNRAHSVTIRNNADNLYPFNTTATFQFVSAKPAFTFTYSGFVDAQGLGLFESTYINSGSTLTITLEPNESIEVRYIGSNGAGGDLFSMQRNLLGLVTIPSSATSFKLYPERRYALPHGYSGALTLQLPLVDRVGTSITLEDVTGYSTSTITALTIVGGGSQTVFAAASVDIKNFIDNGCTVKLVLQSSNNWVYNVQYSSVIRGNTLGVRNTAGTLTSLNVVAATSDRVVTFPNADINFGNLSSVATTDFNTLSGTRTRIVGGSHNTVSGTDNVAIGCTSATLSGARQTAIGAKLNAAITCNNAIVLGSANEGYSATIRHPLFKNPAQTLLISRAEDDWDYTTSLAHSPKAFLTQGVFGASRHTLTFIATAYNATPAGIGSITGSRIFSVRYDGSAYSVSSIDTPVADSATGGLSITFAVSLVTVSGIRVLEIVPTVTGGGVSTHTCYATLESLYMY